ncbi:MAG TPA: tRNA lysidine(34) synthetase TilS, partial [Elusimicrobiota bacterium]|nr:tRNA lysidine(34) synthetase TilS [Elusimicrobiota bacterium]
MTLKPIDSLDEEVDRYLRALLPRGSRILLAISGGPDSVALAHILRSLPYDVRWMHINHQLRRSAASDERFVRDLARRWDVPLRVVRINVSQHRRRMRLGTEDAARRLRYQALEAEAEQRRCRAVLTGHQADDQAETVLAHFLRGTGPAGLAGMPSARHLRPEGRTILVRPLLGVARGELMAYLRRNRLVYCTDPTNGNTRFTRNRLRIQTLPY